jgi:aryl sulfotransferase
MPDRRFLKSHLPADALPIDPRAKYINVGRDPRDVFWSWHNHHMSFTDGFYEFANAQPDREDIQWEKPEPDIRKAYLGWIMHEEGERHGGYWRFTRSWWDLRDQPNVKLFHFNDYKTDLEGSIRRIAAFLDIAFDEERMPAMLEHCGLEHMRNAAKGDPFVDKLFKKGGESFFHKGTNGRWKDVLSAEEAALADHKIDAELSPECAHWIRTGEMPIPA